MTPETEAKLLALPFYSRLPYFECQDGWADLLMRLAERILTLRASGQVKTLVHATQVKEKFGGLRVYYTPGDDVVDGVVKEAEEASWSTCEHCGRPGSIQRLGGTLATLCDDDAEKWKETLRKV